MPADQPSPESVKLNESLVLVEFIADLYHDSGILPKDPVLRAKARLFIDAVSTKFSPANFSVIHNDGDPEQLVQAVEHLQSLLPAEGFAIGEFSAADIAIAPFLGRIKIGLTNDLGGWPAGKGEGPRILGLLQQPKLARFNKYWADLEARPSFVATFDRVSCPPLTGVVHKLMNLNLQEHILEKSKARIAELRAKKYGA